MTFYVFDRSPIPKSYSHNGYHFVEHQVSVNERVEGHRNHVPRFAFYGRRILTESQIREHLAIAFRKGELIQAP